MTEDEKAVLDTVTRLLDAVAGRDKAAMRDVLHPGGVAVRSRDHVELCTPFPEFPDLMPGGDAVLAERFYDPLVRVDDDIAMVWAHYDFFVDGKLHHWGTNIVSLLKRDGRWVISGIADNGRTTERPEGWEISS